MRLDARKTALRVHPRMSQSISRLADAILVERMLDLHKQLAGLSLVKRGVIDALVYRLYGLSEDEVRIVEGG